MTTIEQIKEMKVRKGKTRNDHASGAHRRRAANHDARGQWLRSGGKDAFPADICCGKGNSSKPFKMLSGNSKQSKHGNCKRQRG